MADINLTAQTIINGITNDVKGRSALDNSSDEANGGQFLEVMMARVTASTSSDKELKDMAKQISRRDGVDNAYKARALRAAKGAEQDTSVEKIKAKTVKKTDDKTTAAVNKKEDDVPVEDTKDLDALKKVAKFLVDASEKGDVTLPAEMVQKLKQFLAKGDELNAGDISSFMQDFNAAFRNMIVALPNGTSDTKAIEWPPEVLNALETAGIKTDGLSGKPLTIIDIMRTVKGLVDESQKSANKTLEAERAKNAPVLPQDQQVAIVTSPTKEAAVDTSKATETVASVLIKAAEAAAPAEKAAATTATAAAAAIETKETKKAATVKQDKAAISAPATFVSSFTAPVDVPKEPKAPSLTETYMNSAVPHAKEKDKSDTDSGYESTSKTKQSDNGQVKAAAAAAVTAAAVAADIKAAATPVIADASVNAVGVAASNIDTITMNVKAATKAEVANNAASNVTQQIIAHIKQNANKSSQISVQLTPVELGRVEVRLSIQRDGQVHTVVMVDSPETLSLMQKDASHLERALQQAGLNANTENMSFNLRDQNQAQQFNQGRKRFSRDTLAEPSIADVSVTAASYEQLISDNRVNYHA